MELKITHRKTQTFEKDLGEDDRGRSMVVNLNFRHWTIDCGQDVRPMLLERSFSWYNCHILPVEGSDLEATLAEMTGGKLPGLHGIRKVSDDGHEIEFCWR
jgi:hypothetical protein